MAHNRTNTHRYPTLPIRQHNFDFSPRTHPFATSRPPLINNSDPTSEFMYQMPLMQGVGKSMSEGGGIAYSGSLDLNALNERLQGLGLNFDERLESLGSLDIADQPRPPKVNGQSQVYSPSRYERPPSRANQLPQAPLTKQTPATKLTSATDPLTARTGYISTPLLDPNEPDPNQPYRWTYPSVTELAPNDSVSMYRPARAPSMVRSGRRGGTNVDPGEDAITPGQMYDEIHEQDGESFWSQDNVTQGTPKTSRSFEEEMTVGPTSVWTRGDIGQNMYDMRDRLLDAEARRDQEAMTSLRRQISEAQELAATTARLDAAEKQLRELQARLIAEQVARTQIEQEAGLREDEVKNYQNEWANAVRALRRAREEGKKTDEEKRRIQRCFEEARDKLWKYHEALRVREARAQGKEEGRAEAWQEAGRWMGGCPPIPGVEPIPAVPGAVLRQTPMTGPLYLQSPQLQSPTANSFQPKTGNVQPHPSHQHPQQQQQQRQQQQQQQPPPQQPVPPAQLPMQSIAQLLEWLASNPGALPQALGNQDQPQVHQNVHPQQQSAQHDGAAAQYMGKTETPPQMQQMPSQVCHQQQQPAIVPVMMPVSQSQPLGHSSQVQQQMQQQTYRTAGTQQYSQPHQPTSARSQGKRPPRNIPNTQTTISSHVNAQPAGPALNSHTADSYLERVDHDPGLKKLMAGVRSKTVHTSQVPTAAMTELEPGRQPLTATRSQFDDKPLPPLTLDTHGVTRSHTVRAPPKDSIANNNRRPRRMSLSEGLHNHDHHHQRPMSQIPDGDRYPIFPLPGQSGGHHGFGTVESTNIDHAAPLELSNFRSPNSEYRGGRASDWSTPARFNRGPAAPSAVRNKVASALRKGMDIEPELEDIEEMGENERFTDMPAGQVRPPMEQHGEQMFRPMPSQVDRSTSGPPRPAPSMPNMRHRIQPVMPKPLGHSRTRSESHPGVHHHPQPHSIAALYNAHQTDSAARANDRLPEPESLYRPPKSHSLFIPPQLASAAVSNEVEDVHGGRHSALGLSGVGKNDQGSDGIARMDVGRMKAPTSQISPTNFQPPNSFPAATGVGEGMHTGRVTISLDTPPGQKGHSNAVNTLPSPSVLSSRAKSHCHRIPFFHRRSDSQSREPSQAQLPNSGSDSSAAHTRTRNSYSHTLSRPHPPPILPSAPNHTYQSRQPYEVPLPASRSVAPTAYSRTPDDTPTSIDTLTNEVRTIDFAREIPLPTKGETVYDAKTTVATEGGSDQPVFPQWTASRQLRRRPIASITGKSNKDNGNSASGMEVDPRSYPLPPSRSTMKKASTYAASVPPIEEVTEPESGRDTIRRSRVLGTVAS
ncbi:hypothetical protein C360_01191 [Cryptococcus neoformans Bt15]|nr:hypothetical protein C360_01191 [Cryptococcus neoformans var. grubii Bt15]